MTRHLLTKLALIYRDIPAAVSKLSPIGNLWIMQSSRGLVSRGRQAFIVELNELVSLCSFKILDLRKANISPNGRKIQSTTLHLNNLASKGFSYLGVAQHLAKVVRTMEQSSHVTLLTTVTRYNFQKRKIITQKYNYSAFYFFDHARF